MKRKPDDITAIVSTTKRWLDNPISRSILNFITRKDRCGDRLSLAIDHYLGREINACWRCRFAGELLSLALGTGGEIFGVGEEEIKKSLEGIYFRRGLTNVLRGMARYGVRMPGIVDAPFLVVWDCTHLCNLKCKHCYIGAKEKMEGELTTEEGKRLIDEMRDAGVIILAFSGGEPLMRKDFFELADYAHRNDLYVTSATNGTLITEEVAKKLKESGVEYVEISIDGKDADTHDSFRGVPGMFDRTIEGVKNCMDQGLQTGIATTVTQHNYDQIEEIHDLASDLGVKRFICFNFVPTGRGIDIIKDDISPEQREELLKFLLKKTYEGGMESLSTAPQLARVAIEEEKGIPVGHFYAGKRFEGKTRALTDFIGGCGAGRFYCSIEPNGDVYPCVFLPIKCGNIRERPLSDIWHESPIFKELRDRSSLKGHCSECENKFVCGGCRARAWAYFKDLNAPDPGCINNKKIILSGDF